VSMDVTAKFESGFGSRLHHRLFREYRSIDISYVVVRPLI